MSRATLRTIVVGCKPETVFVLSFIMVLSIMALASGLMQIFDQTWLRKRDLLLYTLFALHCGLTTFINVTIIYALITNRPHLHHYAMLINSVYFMYTFAMGITLLLFRDYLEDFLTTNGRVLIVVVVIILGLGYSINMFLAIRAYNEFMKRHQCRVPAIASRAHNDDDDSVSRTHIYTYPV